MSQSSKILWIALLFLLLAWVVSAQNRDEIGVGYPQGADGLYSIQCQVGCDLFAQLGTPEELSRRFVVLWDAIDYYYFLLGRKHNVQLAPIARPTP